MSRKWLRQCLPLSLAVLFCAGGFGTTGIAQEGAEAAAQPPANPAPADTAAAADTAAPAKAAATDDQAASPPAAAAAKDEPAAAAPDAPDAPPAGDKTQPAAPGTEPPAAPTADPAADQAAFMAKFEEWKTVLKGLRTLASRYTVATPEEATGIQKEWDDLIAQGERLIPELRATGLAAYASSRGGERIVERFLTKLLADDITHDRYEQAYDLGKSLIASGCEVKEVFDGAGVAAFATNDFDGAETYLKRAQDAGGLSEKGQHDLGLIDQYKVFWAQEKAIREKEAAADDLPRVKITTNRGDIIVELFENEAPGTVGNFISLIDKKFYDGLTFHRVLPGFMAQGGCPQGNGSGGPGYQIKCETGENHRIHFRGTLSMAHAGKDTGGSQFFLTFVPTANLNGLHTAFGRVIEGMDVLEKIRRIDPEKPNPSIKPDTIIKMEVLRRREHEYKPNKAE